MKGVGTTVNSVESMVSLVNSVKKELNDLADYLVAEGVRLDKRIVRQAEAEGEEVFAQVYGGDAKVAGHKVYIRMADAADRAVEAVRDLERAADLLRKVTEAIKAVRAKRSGSDVLQV